MFMGLIESRRISTNINLLFELVNKTVALYFRKVRYFWAELKFENRLISKTDCGFVERGLERILERQHLGKMTILSPFFSFFS